MIELESVLGKSTTYPTTYAPHLLFAIQRTDSRKEIGIETSLPFYGYDIWNAYEMSWLNQKGKPIVAIAQFIIRCDSVYLVESKSLKLYLNSFNNTKYHSFQDVKTTLEKDLKCITHGKVEVHLFELEAQPPTFHLFQGECLDALDIACEHYRVTPRYLSSDPTQMSHESLYSNLLKSNCLVTGQPDWGSVLISYEGPTINREGLLKYIVSFRHHNEFHEHCVERIFVDILKFCGPTKLTVEARYTRRGGIDINPIRSTENISPGVNIRLLRQ